MEIQTRLAELGYSPGPADGIAGRGTRQAVLEYQNAAGIYFDEGLTGCEGATSRPRRSSTWCCARSRPLLPCTQTALSERLRQVLQGAAR